ncbi:MAG TPA: DNA polymerase I [Syntrophorhabdaceae bacterium]|nr:DNA polymerase I [Syntrophorhabdaceae bacterium]
MDDEIKKINNSLSRSKKIFLVDGHSYLYRAFFATPHLSNSVGLPTNAIYAFINMIKKLIKSHSPDVLAVAFDSKAPSFREEIFKEYKAQRPPMPDNLSIQIPYVKKIISAMGFEVLEKEGYEADDIIGTIVKSLEGVDAQIWIITGDKDMMQLVTDRVFLYDTMKNAVIGAKEVEERFGIPPCRMIDFLALTGDTSDNIPGVSGIGDITAKSLVNEFGSLENIYKNIDKIKRDSVKKKLINGKDSAFMSKALATIKTDCPVDFNIFNCEVKKEDTDALRVLYRELEFVTLLNELKPDKGDVKKIQKAEKLEVLNDNFLGIEVEIQGKTAPQFELAKISISDGLYIYNIQDKEKVPKIIEYGKSIAIHNLKPFIVLLKKDFQDFRLSMSFDQKFFDTMLAAYLINPLRKSYRFSEIADEYLGDGSQRGVSCLPELKEILKKKLLDLNLEELFSNIEMPLVEVLAEMEFYGVKVDRKILNELSRDFDKRINSIVKEIYSISGVEPFNINSPMQLSRVLFDILKLPPQKKTKTGYSTDTEVLEALSPIHPLPGKILEYRTLSKLKSTYIDAFPMLINPSTGRIHASFNQMVVATGRLSSSDPNLQNIPIRGEEGKKIREAFVAEDGYLLLSSDYSQIELRVLAHLSQDPILIETFLKDEDIHTKVAIEVFGVSPDNVTPDMRRTAKVINFGIIYGMSGFGLSKELGISQRDAQDYIDAYLLRYRGVKEYMERVIEEARENGYVRTLFGRIRYLPELKNSDNTIRQLGERAAMNTPIQGTAADIIKIAMINIFKRIKKENLCSRIIMQIHDELVLEVKEDEVESVEGIVKEEMEGAVRLSVPLKVSIGKGKNWSIAHN